MMRRLKLFCLLVAVSVAICTRVLAAENPLLSQGVSGVTLYKFTQQAGVRRQWRSRLLRLYLA